MGKYRTIVADPPWDYSGGFANNPKPGNDKKQLPYPSMSIWQIAALPVAGLADKNCRLFLWTTNRYLRDSFMVLDAWGFKYSQTLVWHKTGNPSPFAGTGIAPIHAEYVLVGKKGAPVALAQLDSSVIAANVGNHSAKPEGFLDWFESVSPGPYLELFARRNRLGWDTWGNESLPLAEMAS